MYYDESTLQEINETPLWERRSTISRSVPDVSLSENVEKPMRAASDFSRDRPVAIPLVQTLNDNEDLKTRNQLQRLEIIRLKEIIVGITGHDKFQLAEEFHDLKSREVETIREKKEIEAAYQDLLENTRLYKNKIDELEQEKEHQSKWAEEISEAYKETKRQLDEARQRFPWMDESVDSIFGDANQRHIGDLKQKIEELEYEREDLITAKEKMAQERDEALVKMAEWSTKGTPGDKTFSVDVGDLHKVTFQEKIDELQHAIDDRDAKIREQDQDYKKALRLLTNVEKSKAQLEQQVTSLTMTMHAQTTTDRNELRESAIGTEERRMETASEWLGHLSSLGQENEQLRKALIELGGKYREMSMREGSLVPEEIESILTYAEQVQGNLNKQQDLFNFSEHAFEANDLPKDISLGVINQSINTKESLDEMKEKITTLKSTTHLLFDRVKGASELLAKILQHIKDDKSDFAEEIRRMTLGFDDNLRRGSIAALDEIEVAFNDASWVLEKSISESFVGMSSLTQIMSRLGAGHSNPDVNVSFTRSFTKLANTARVLPSSPHFVDKETYDELRNEHDSLTKEYAEAKATWNSEKEDLANGAQKCAQLEADVAMLRQLRNEHDLLTKEYAEAKATWNSEKQDLGNGAQKCAQLEADVAMLRRQWEVAEKKGQEATFANSELKEELERLQADEAKFRHLIEENRRLLQERDSVIENHESELNKYHERQAKFESKSHDYLQKISKLEAIRDEQEMNIQKLRDQIEEFVAEAKRYKDLEAEYKYQIETLSNEAEKATTKYQEVVLQDGESAKRTMEKCKNYEKLLTNAQAEISQLKKANDEDFKQVETQVLNLRVLVGELARLRGDNKDESTMVRSHPDERPLSSQINAQLEILIASMKRACDWTKQQIQQIHENNRKAEQMYAQMRNDAATRKPSKDILEVQGSALTLTESDDAKENVPLSATSSKRFKDPLRSEFYDISTRTDQIVQQLKSIAAKTAVGGLLSKVLEDSRDLRSLVSAKYQALMEPVKDGDALTNSELLERIAIMWQQIHTYQQALVEARKLFKETKESLDRGGSSRCRLDDQLLGSQIENELFKIKDVLTRCGSTVKARQALVEQGKK